ncbi:hypothetical protein PR202_ga05993 [Eleusine coracana subsp. coracana]|uniref:MPN domain-containing protein n=1 Tax=Eleusine coracana subsp. coracana TaxID=191504 RepID=A0AAV5BTN7_ELECO|nr:hypothetical protein PR202_ga05993 [Eleusine coracana subsp. coracana]
MEVAAAGRAQASSGAMAGPAGARQAAVAQVPRLAEEEGAAMDEAARNRSFTARGLGGVHDIAPPSLSSAAPSPAVLMLEASVVINIRNAYLGRPHEKKETLIGTLLGFVHPDGTVHVRNSYVVPHIASTHQVAFDVEIHRVMHTVFQKANPEDAIVG